MLAGIAGPRPVASHLGLLLQVAVILVDPMKGETEHLST